MPLETGTRVTDLVVTNPPATDLVSQGDDHIRLLKTVIKNDVLNALGAQAIQNITVATGAITPAALSSAIINLTGEGSLADNLDTITATNKFSGNFIMLKGADAANAVTVKHNTGNIQLLRSKDAVLDSTTEYLLLWYDGTNWREVIRGDLSEILDGDTIAALTVTALTAAGGALSGTFTGNPTFSGSPIFSGLLGPTGWPSFSVNKSTVQNILTSTPTKVTWDTEVFDSNGNFAANAFTPTVSGKYLFCISIAYADLTGGDDFIVFLYKNSIELHRVARLIAAADAGRGNLGFSVIVEATASDVFEVYVDSGVDASYAIYGQDSSVGRSIFSGSRIG